MIKSKLVRFWSILTLILLALWLICYAYDQSAGNADGLIGNLVYQNIFTFLLSFDALGFLLSLGVIAKRKIIHNLTLSVISSLFFILLLEGIGHLIIRFKLIDSTPIVFRRFYLSPEIINARPFPAGDLNSITGRWHVPDSPYAFVNCEGDSIHWHYNSVGANDKERSTSNPNPAKKRIAIVGDSFVEGYMVNNADRCSNILERKTGLEHLNFAVNGSNPVNYYLTYKAIVKPYDTDVLIVGFLPANDFESRSDKSSYTLVDWPMYVPYWEGTYPNYALHYSLAKVNQSMLYGHHTQVSLLKVIDSVYASLPLSGKLKADFLAHSSIFQLLGELHANSYKAGRLTKFDQFSNGEWQYASYSLTKLIQEAKDKKVIILSIPTLWDIKALKNGKTNRLDGQLATFCRQHGVAFIPLTPSFLAYKGNPEKLYVSCDGHWSAQGESFAADVLFHNPIYRSSIGLDTEAAASNHTAQPIEPALN
jgi:hypothetical protein